MKKITSFILSIVVAIAIVIDGYLLFFQKNNSTNNSLNNSSTSTNTTTTSTSSTSTSSSKLKDGTYTGASTSTQWGDVQLSITVSNGKITAIDVIKYPNSESKSISINQQVLPTYKQEAISAQSSEINQVSGATETYKGFTGSLADAINQAES